MKRQVTDQLRSHFRPEFLNRIDEVIVFHALTDAELAAIVDLPLADLQRRIAATDLVLELTPAARQLIVREGTDPAYGARPLKRTIQRLVENPFARALLSGQFKPGDVVTADADPVSGTLVFSSESGTVVADAVGPSRRPIRRAGARGCRGGSRLGSRPPLRVRPAAARRGRAPRRRRARQLAAVAASCASRRRSGGWTPLPDVLPEAPEALIPVLAETGAARPRPRWASRVRPPGGGPRAPLPGRGRRGAPRPDRARGPRRPPLRRGLVPGRRAPSRRTRTSSRRRCARRPRRSGSTRWRPASACSACSDRCGSRSADYAVTPVVAVAARRPSLTAQPTEVATILEAPRRRVPARWAARRGRARAPWLAARYAAYPVEGLHVWGMTAQSSASSARLGLDG